MPDGLQHSQLTGDHSTARRTSVIARIKHATGLDRAIGFTILARGWSTLAGVLTVLLIARFLSPSEQGYYYTFSSLVALQVVFELGFSFVILQLAAHERAHLVVAVDGSITGDPISHSRLASVLQKAVRWYTVGAILMFSTLLPVGFHFFRTHQQSGVSVAWRLPWVAIVLAATCTFQMDPIFAFIEGCGRVPLVARMRFTQALGGTLLAWAALLLHHGLFAPAMIIGGQAITGACFLFTQRSLLFPLLRHRTANYFVSWRREIWPFQWRIALSWLCGYFIFQLFNPVLFAYRSAAEAGRMGMSLSMAAALSTVAISWISTKASPFGSLVAQRDFATLDRVFFRTLAQSSILLICGALVLLLALAVAERRFPLLASRVLPLPIFALLLLTTCLNHIVFSQAVYLRAHKQEPFLKLSILVGVLTGASTIVTGKLWGAAGVTIGYFIASGVVGLAVGSLIFISKRREWHRSPASIPVPDVNVL
jgi:uncharacterized membrane protein